MAAGKARVPEVIDDGVTGIIVDDVDEGIRALPRVIAMDRRAVRRRFEERFSATRMAKDYLSLYRSLLKSSRSAGHEADEIVRRAPDMTVDAPRAYIDS